VLAALRDIGVLAAGIGLFVLGVVGAYVLLNLNRSLTTVHEMLETSERELRQTLPEVRQTAEQIHQMVRQVNHRVQATDQLVTTTGDVVGGLGERVWQALRAPAASVRNIFKSARGRTRGHQPDPHWWEEEKRSP
jgi:uncharacterized protein YoxC